ncbi:protein cereblon-like isoform X2 [Symsagittifera roscoffensis]|uniref:protein cereblon-like isoform X2 n=1 Tax=Symsagittifera roscoffensis TaxID=84072 RepID=UPI00307B209B
MSQQDSDENFYSAEDAYYEDSISSIISDSELSQNETRQSYQEVIIPNTINLSNNVYDGTANSVNTLNSSSHTQPVDDSGTASAQIGTFFGRHEESTASVNAPGTATSSLANSTSYSFHSPSSSVGSPSVVRSSNNESEEVQFHYEISRASRHSEASTVSVSQVAEDEQQEVMVMDQSEEDDEDILDYNEDNEEVDSNTEDEDEGEEAENAEGGPNGVGIMATNLAELAVLTGTGANIHPGERVRQIDDANVPGLSSDQIQSMNFDLSLPDRHQYLGDDMEVLAGRTVHEEKDVLVLPFMRQVAHVLLPKQSMPMYFNRQTDVALLRRVLSGDKTFVILPLLDRVSVRNFVHSEAVGKIAVIAEVVMSSEDDLDNFKVIAEGRQRCRVLEYLGTYHGDGVKSLRVQILPDNNLQYNLFQDIDRHLSLQYLTLSNSKHIHSPYSISPKYHPWIIEANNVYALMAQIRNILCSLFKNESGMAKLVYDDPSDFSFLVASFLPLSNRVKHKLLESSCALHRLKLEREFLRRCEFLYCSQCGDKLASVSEVIVMSNTGALASYVNPVGVIYETLTLNKLSVRVNCVGRPQTENSWFPGYAWTPASCDGCHSHLGWLFTKAKGAPVTLKPNRFWGLSHSALSLDTSIERYLLGMPTSAM